MVVSGLPNTVDGVRLDVSQEVPNSIFNSIQATPCGRPNTVEPCRLGGVFSWMRGYPTVSSTVFRRQPICVEGSLAQPPSCLLEIKEDSQYIIHIYAPACAQLLIS